MIGGLLRRAIELYDFSERSCRTEERLLSFSANGAV